MFYTKGVIMLHNDILNYINGKIKFKELLAKTNYSERHLRRLISNVKKENINALIHKNKGKKANNKINIEIEKEIINLYKDKWDGCNFHYFYLSLEERLKKELTYQTLRNIMYRNNIISPKANRRTKREFKKKLNSKNTNSNHYKEIEKTIDRVIAHPRKPKCKYFGEIVEMDACFFKWNGEEKWALHVAIDQATNELLALHFDKQETLNGYFHVLGKILYNYGIPYSFLTDNRTVFHYKKQKKVSFENDTKTNFSFACSNLGTTIITTSIPQQKGLVERCNQTLKDQLFFDLKINNIKTIEQANEYLEIYRKKFNDNYSIRKYNTISKFECIEKNKIEYYLSTIHPRVISSGHVINFENKIYLPFDENGDKLFLSGQKVIVIKTITNKLLMNIGESIYTLKEVPKNYKYSKEFDVDYKKARSFEKPLSHPFKSPLYLKRLKKLVLKQKHLNQDKIKDLL